MKVRALTTGVAVLALAVPAAQAANQNLDGGSSSQAASAPSTYSPAALRAMAAHQHASEQLPASEAPAVRPDDRGGVLGAGTVEQPAPALSPDNRSGIRGPGAVEPPTIVTVSQPSSFDWGDFLIGAGATVALVALLLAARRYSPRPTRRESLRTS